MVALVSVTGLAYLDATRRIDEKQKEIDKLRAEILTLSDEITMLSTVVSSVAGSLDGIEVII